MIETITPKHRMGWRGMLPGMSLLFPQADTTSLPVRNEVDPRTGLMQPIDDQGQLGSCTADATSNVFRYDAILDGSDPGALSRLWIYRYERKIEGSFDQGDVGAYGHDAFRVARHGIPAEKLWPYDVTKFQNDPPPAAVAARAYRLQKQVHTPSQTELAFKQVLSNDQTIAYGFTVYESYENVGTDGIVPVPARHEQVLGGHEQVIVGYTKALPAYALVRGSWGTGFGAMGYVYFPWSMLLDPNMCSDFRTIVRPV